MGAPIFRSPEDEPKIPEAPMRMRTATAEEILARGVWLAPYLFDGHEVLIAVDSRGCVRKHVKLAPEINLERAVRWLEALLDRLDPVAAPLQLVKSAPTPKPFTAPTPMPNDPRGESHLDQALRLARLRAKAFRRVHG